ncbi:MAG: SsrA-binding protein SmpB [Bacteroidales bacterium]
MKFKDQIEIQNKKAGFDYEIIDKFTAGIVLTGTEIKSLRLGKANLTDAFCFIQNSEVWAKNIHISEYAFGSYNNHIPKRDRKLLLKHAEIRKIETKLKDVGVTITVTKIFINESGRAKVEIALARGKKQFDKREAIKEKDVKRDLDRAMKQYK